MSDHSTIETRHHAALERAILDNKTRADRLMEGNDYSAEIFAEDAKALREVAELLTAADKSCTWTEDYQSTWETACGTSWGFVDGGPADNHMNYCHHCGGRLVAVPYDEDAAA